MKENEAISRMRYRVETATHNIGKGVDGKAYEDMEMAIKALEEIQQYRAIGTVEECREARERCKEKKWERGIGKDVRCPICGTYTTDIFEHRYCTYCGQRLD